MTHLSHAPTTVDMTEIFNNPKYRGRHVIAVGDKIFTAKTGQKAGRIIEQAHQDYPNLTLKITYVPDADVLIL